MSPDEWKAKRTEQTRQRNCVILKPQPPQTKPSYIDNATFNKSLAGYEHNTLIKGLCQIAGQEKTMQAVRMFCVGTAKGATVFWQLDTDNKVRTGKVIHYKPDLHRDKEKSPYWVHKLRNLPGYDPHYNLQQCLFGLHLLNDITAPVAIVESEKTAIIVSIYLPAYVWLATGGKQNINFIEKQSGACKGERLFYSQT